MTRTRILLADDDPIYRERIESVINAQPDMVVSASVDNGGDALRLLETRELDIALLDIQMPHINGTELAGYIHDQELPVLAVMLTTFELEGSLAESLEANVAGFLTKDAPPESIVSCLRMAQGGTRVFGERPLSMMTNGYIRQTTVGKTDPEFIALLDRLPPRLIPVLDQVMHGKNNAVIAQMLGLSESTVKSYVSDLLMETGCENRAMMAIKALRCGYSPPLETPTPKRSLWERLSILPPNRRR